MVEGAAVAGALLAAVGRGTWAAAGGTGQGEAAMALAAAAGAAQAAEGAWLQSAGEKVKASLHTSGGVLHGHMQTT